MSEYRDLLADCGAEWAALRALNAELVAALEATLPALILLGDHIGNEHPGTVGIESFDRCAIIGNARAALAKAKA